MSISWIMPVEPKNLICFTQIDHVMRKCTNYDGYLQRTSEFCGDTFSFALMDIM